MQVVGHPDLQGWDGSNPPLLGDIVAAVIQEFSRINGGVNSAARDQNTTSWGGPSVQQPSGFPAAQPAPTRYGVGASAAGLDASAPGRAIATDSSQRRGSETHAKKARPKHQTPIPAIPSSFSELQGLSTEKLSRLLEDESARQALLLGMASVVQMKDLRTDVRKGNVETARQTIAKQDAASVLRKEGEMMKAELKSLQASYEGKVCHLLGENLTEAKNVSISAMIGTLLWSLHKHGRYVPQFWLVPCWKHV